MHTSDYRRKSESMTIFVSHCSGKTMLHGQTKASWYDTGASFLEDIKSHKNGAHGKRINIKSLMEHLKSGSWRNESQAKSWIEQHKDLWFTEPEKESKPKTAKRAISKKK